MLSQARHTATFRRGVLLRAAKLAVSRASSAALLPAHVTRGAVADSQMVAFSFSALKVIAFQDSQVRSDHWLAQIPGLRCSKLKMFKAYGFKSFLKTLVFYGWT